MKKRSTRVTLLLVLLALAHMPVAGATNLKLGISGNYWALSDPLYKSIYGSGSPAWGASAGLVFSGLFEFRAEFVAFKGRGAMTASGEDLTLTLRPMILGLRLTPLKAGRILPFVGAGTGSMSVREDYPERIKDFSESTKVSLLEAGCYCRVMKRVQVAAVFRVMNAKSTSVILDQTIKLGGLRPGLEVAYTF